MKPAPEPLSRPLLFTIAGALYFSEGLPYGVITELMPIFLRERGASLTAIGMLGVVSLAWTAKVLWAPAVDRFWSYRTWIRGSLLVIALSLAGFAAFEPSDGALLWLLAGSLAIASATQDIGIDALTIRMTPKPLLGIINSIRVTTYRGALIVAGGALAAVATAGGWRLSFAIGAGIALLLLAGTTLVPPDASARSERLHVVPEIRRWINRPGSGLLIGVILLYRLGDSSLAPMIKPFWVDAGYSAAEIGTVTTAIGMSFLIAGAWIGGIGISRIGLWKSLLLFGVIQMLSNLGYAWLATFGGARPSFYTVSSIEHFTGGLGVAAFLAFLMAICDKEYAATEYAILSALFVVSRSLSSAGSGILSDWMGYAPFFWLTVLLAVPGLLLLPFIRPLLSSDDERFSKIRQAETSV